MPRCANCGKANKDGSLFCQDCGQKLEEAPPRKRTASSPGIGLDGPTCPACGAVNPVGMGFCKMCGTNLGPALSSLQPTPVAVPAVVAAVVAAPVPAGGPKVSCGSCGKQTPSGFAFCQHCGQKLGTPAAVIAAPRTAPAAVAPTIAVNPTPPGGMRPPAVSAPVAAAAPSVGLAPTMAVSPSQARPAVAPATTPAMKTPAATLRTERPAAITDKDRQAVSVGRLVVVRRDGSDGEAHPLVSDTFDIGRTEGSLTFADDPYLAQRHARLVVVGTSVKVRPIDTVNGIYLRLRAPAEIGPGDQILVGKEVLRFEPLALEERDPPSLVEHGVRIFGSVQREAWGRLRQLTGAGTTRDVWHLTRPEMVLGREEGDVTFPDDEYLSRRHAAVRRVPQGQGPKTARLEDLGSSNGTFLRLRGEQELKTGDVLRLGDQLLRFEV